VSLTESMSVTCRTGPVTPLNLAREQNFSFSICHQGGHRSRSRTSDKGFRLELVAWPEVRRLDKPDQCSQPSYGGRHSADPVRSAVAGPARRNRCGSTRGCRGLALQPDLHRCVD
jgi:hypothetical protein